MVFIGHRSGLARLREHCAFPDLLRVLWLPGFLCWTSRAAGREEPVCWRDHWPAADEIPAFKQDFRLCRLVLEAAASCLLDFSENCPPGKRPFNFSHSWKATAQDLTRGSDAFCLGAGGVASSAAASWATLAVYTMVAVKGLQRRGEEPACLRPDLYQSSGVGMGTGKTNPGCR